MAILPKSTGGGGRPYTGSTEITPSSSQTTIPPDTLLDKGLTIKPVPTETKAVTPSKSDQAVTPSSGKFFSSVTVSGDSDLIASNIREGVNIFGVTGSYYGTYNIVDATSVSFSTSHTGSSPFYKWYVDMTAKFQKKFDNAGAVGVLEISGTGSDPLYVFLCGSGPTFGSDSFTLTNTYGIIVVQYSGLSLNRTYTSLTPTWSSSTLKLSIPISTVTDTISVRFAEKQSVKCYGWE